MNDQAGRDRNQRIRAQSDERFSAWIAEPLTKLAISGIPAGDNRDTLQLLLRSAFDAGVGCGQGAFAAELLEQFIRRDERRGGGDRG